MDKGSEKSSMVTINQRALIDYVHHVLTAAVVEFSSPEPHVTADTLQSMQRGCYSFAIKTTGTSRTTFRLLPDGELFLIFKFSAQLDNTASGRHHVMVDVGVEFETDLCPTVRNALDASTWLKRFESMQTIMRNICAAEVTTFDLPLTYSIIPRKEWGSCESIVTATNVLQTMNHLQGSGALHGGSSCIDQITLNRNGMLPNVLDGQYYLRGKDDNQHFNFMIDVSFKAITVQLATGTYITSIP